MNIQIFGTKKSFDTKKAQRYFKERRSRSSSSTSRKRKGMSKGELAERDGAVGGIDAVIDPNAKDQDTVALTSPYLAESQKFDKLLENQQIPARAHRTQRPEGDGGVLPGRLEDLGIRRACGWWLW